MTTSFETGLRDGTWTVLPEDTVATFVVRKLGLIRVRGGLTVTDGSVTVAGGQPVAATATLDAASVRTGIGKRDLDLHGKSFFHTERHPSIGVRTTAVAPDGDGWSAAAVLTVAGGETPLDLRVVTLPGREPGTVRITVNGVLDRAATAIHAPRWLIGRWVTVEAHATLQPPG